MNPSKIKTESVHESVHPLIAKRWSPLSYSEKKISEDLLQELFTAASWAPSAYNDQPWRYIYAHRGTEGFDQLWECLAAGNQPWTKNASVIFVAMKQDTFTQNGKVNKWAEHDLGMANAQLLLQAVHHDIYGHFMAGFDAEKVKSTFNVEDNVTPVCMGVLGYLGDADKLDESYRNRELSKRSRKPLSNIIRKV